MTAQKKKFYRTSGAALLVVLVAYLFRLIGKGKLLSHAVFLSAQLSLYRPVRRLGAVCPAAHCAVAGQAVSDQCLPPACFLDGRPLGQVFYLLAARRDPISMVSVLSAHAICADAGAAHCHVPRQAG